MSANGYAYSGTFTIMNYDATGTIPQGNFEGKITGTRITMNITTP